MILVLDDEWLLRKPVLTALVGDRAELRGIRNFTIEALRGGDAAAGITLDMIAAFKPMAIISDLSIILRDRENPVPGIALLSKLLGHSELKGTPLIIVSKHTGDRRVKAHLDRLGAVGVFAWRDLSEGNAAEQERFSRVIDRVLRLT